MEEDVERRPRQAPGAGVEAEEAMAARLRDEILRASSLSGGLLGDLTVALPELEVLSRSWDATAVRPSGSLPVRLARRILGRLLYPVHARQSRHAHATTSSLVDLAERLDRLQKELERLETEIARGARVPASGSGDAESGN